MFPLLSLPAVWWITSLLVACLVLAAGHPASAQSPWTLTLASSGETGSITWTSPNGTSTPPALEGAFPSRRTPAHRL